MRAEYDAIDRRVDEYVVRRGEAIVELARHDLPDISQASVEQTYAGIRDDLRSILARKERAQAELQGRLARCQSAIGESQQQVAAAAVVLNQLVAKRTELQQQAAERLKGDAEFQQLSQQALAAEMQLKANEERAEELQLDAAEKLPAYDRSRLFGYLYNRRFGTPEYAHRGWTRSLDRWVAKLIEFERHRVGYDFLRKTPELVKAEVDRRRVAFHAQMEQVEAIEARVSDDVGLSAVLEQGRTQGAEHDRFSARLAQEQAQAQQVESELHALNAEQGRFYVEALERYTRFLSDTETSVLQARASQTADPRDDELVSRIAWLTEEIARLRPDVQAIETRSRDAEQRSEGLSFVVRRAEQANLDSDRCTAEDLGGVERDVERFLAGAMNQNDLWRAIQDRLKFEPTWVETAATGAGQMLNHPTSHVLLQALAQAASVALQQSAERSVQRRTQVNQPRRIEIGGSPPRITRPTPSKGFTTRGGF
jgi:chromosome segregation ATPase